MLPCVVLLLEDLASITQWPWGGGRLLSAAWAMQEEFPYASTQPRGNLLATSLVAQWWDLTHLVFP